MAHLYAGIEGRERGCRRGRGVAMDQHPVGSHLAQHSLHALEDGGGDVGKSLRILHHLEIRVRAQIEEADHLIQHFRMLARQADLRMEARIGGEREHHRRHLDRLGTSAENA